MSSTAISLVFNIGDLVRIRPKNGKRHFGRGVIKGFEGAYAIVQPFPRHGHFERVLISDLLPWKSANAAHRELAARRARA